MSVTSVRDPALRGGSCALFSWFMLTPMVYVMFASDRPLGKSGGSHPYPENRPLWTVVCCFRWRAEGVPTNSAEDAAKLKRNQVRVAGQRKFLSVGGSERNQSRIIFFFDFRISTLAAACACLPTGWRLACVAVALRPTLWVSGRTSLVSH